MRGHIHFLAVCSLATGLVGAKDCKSAAGRLSQPSLYQSPRFRWWWPGGWVDPDEVTSEITSIVNAGFGGGEIGDVQDSVKVDLDPKIYGWAQSRWNTAVQSAYETANKLGGHVDMTLGPHWPTGFPGYTPDSPETMKELVHGQIFLSPGQSYSGSLPLPDAAPSGNETGNIVTATPKLEAVIVARTFSSNTSSTVVQIDPDTIEVITSSVTGNSSIQYTAPSNGTYVLVAVYGRGTGQIQNMYDASPNGPKLTDPYPAYIVDHFSEAGVQAGVKYWEENILTTELKALLAKSQGSIFEDSLELKIKQYWTTNFTAEFLTRRGYDLTPFFLYVLKDTNTFSGSNSTASQVVNDFYQTVSDLYTDYRVAGLVNWANSIGLKFRAQPYTASFDSSYAASLLDIPEGESLGFEGDDDAFRVLAAGRDIGGKTTILSDELGAYMGKAYGVTWSFLIGTLNHDMSLGVSQGVIHGFPYRDSPSSLWPGFAPFTPLGTSSNGFADAWGPRQPHWMFANNASFYISRAQMLLQEGGPSIDVAVLNQAWGVTKAWADSGLNSAGYSYQFPTPVLLEKHNVGVEEGRLAPNGPAYKALVVDNETAIDVSTAQSILSWAQDGLPVVWVGAAPTTTFSYSADPESASDQLESLYTEITSLKTTKVVSAEADVPDALSDLGIQPSVRYSSDADGALTTYRKTLGSGYLYWIYNNGNVTYQSTVGLNGSGSPYSLDLWTGTVLPIPDYTSSDGYISVKISLTETSVAVVYVGPTNPFNAPTLSDHLVSTTCESYASGSRIYLTSNVSCSATTANGRNVSLDPGSLSSPITLPKWNLTVQDWSPAVVNETGLQSPRTTKTLLPTVSLEALAAWPNITSLEYASGVGYYDAVFSLGETAKNVRTLLLLGEVGGTFGVKVNGKRLDGLDFFGNKKIDLTSYVKAGSNEIQVTVATTLWNKLIKVWPAIYGSSTPQQVGLLGPVSVWQVKDLLV